MWIRVSFHCQWRVLLTSQSSFISSTGGTMYSLLQLLAYTYQLILYDRVCGKASWSAPQDNNFLPTHNEGFEKQVKFHHSFQKKFTFHMWNVSVLKKKIFMLNLVISSVNLCGCFSIKCRTCALLKAIFVVDTSISHYSTCQIKLGVLSTSRLLID